MSFLARAILFPLLIGLAACSGGGSSDVTVAGAAWPRFRHDSGNTGQGSAGVYFNNGETKGSFDLRGQVSASVAVDSNGTVYIGTESCTASECAAIALPGCPCAKDGGGTLFAVDPDSVQPRWATQENPTCAGNRQLGAMISSPAVYTSTDTNIFVGSQDGRVHGFKDPASATQPTPLFCFDPTLLSPEARVLKARFTSSPTFTLTSASSTVDGIFLGAVVERVAGQEEGRIYSIANDGTLRWQFPRPGGGSISPVTSSPALVTGSLYFITSEADGTGKLYSLDSSGNLKWSRTLSQVVDANVPFAISPVAGTSGVFLATADGTFQAWNADGSERWRRSDSSRRFAGSLGFGSLPSTPFPTETPTPLESPTPQPTATGAATATPTPTLTPIPFASSATLVGVTIDGRLVMLGAPAPTPVSPSDSLTVEGQVLGSPALSSDGQVIFASSTAEGGLVYVIDMLTGLPPATPTGTPSPVPWPKSIEGSGVISSPVLDNDGTIWIVTLDGRLYAIGTNS